MPSVSIACAPAPLKAAMLASANSLACAPAITKAMPGLVQNCPAPMVNEAAQPWASAPARVCIAFGRQNIGLTEPNSPKNGIGSGRLMHRLNKALPPAKDPVNPTARISGCCTTCAPTSCVLPCKKEKTPGC